MKIIPHFERLHSGEINSRVLEISISEDLSDKKVRLGFITPMGKVFISEELEISDGGCLYTLPDGLLDGKGILMAQLLISRDDSFVMKSRVYEFRVFASVDDMSVPGVSDESLRGLAVILDLIDRKSDTGHLHEGVYLTREEIRALFSDIPYENHGHDSRYYTEAETDELMRGKSDKEHNHDGLYAKKEEAQPYIYDLALDNGSFLLSFKGNDTAAALYSDIENGRSIIIRATDSNGVVLFLRPSARAFGGFCYLECITSETGYLSYLWGLDADGFTAPVVRNLYDYFGDYVSEAGTEGIWHYRKWASGEYECTAEVTHIFDEAVEAGGNFRFTLSFPAEFRNAPLVMVHPRAGAYQMKKAYSLTPTKKDTVIYVQTESGQGFSQGDFVSFYVEIKGSTA